VPVAAEGGGSAGAAVATAGQAGGGVGGSAPPGEEAGAGDRRAARSAAHEVLGQTHGLMTIAMREGTVEIWCPAELREVVLASAPQLWLAFGQAQAAVAGGEHDRRLVAAGFGPELAAPKRRGAAGAVQRLHQDLSPGSPSANPVRGWLRNAISWVRGPIGSMSFIPGVEIIGEGLDVIHAALGQEELWGNAD